MSFFHFFFSIFFLFPLAKGTLTESSACLVAAVWILLQFAIFAGDTSRSSYSYSFYLTLVAFLLCLAAGVCFLLATLTARPKVEDAEVETEEVREDEAAESTKSKLNNIRAFWKHPPLD